MMSSQRWTAALRAAGILLLLALWVGIIGWRQWHPDHRIIYRDSNLMGVPSLQYLGEAIRGGFLPWLHPRRGCGTPFLADPQTQALYPPAWLVALFPPVTAFRLHQFAHLLLLGAGFAFLARFRGVGMAGSLVAGCVAVAAQTHLAQLEWLPTMAGTAWVPWSLLAAMGGAPGWWTACLAMMIASGHAYIWVMAPVLAGAGLLLAPERLRRRFLLCMLLLPAITAPCWIGYFALTGDAHPHGLADDTMLPVTNSKLWHLSLFLFPAGISPYGFAHADGRISWIPVEPPAVWAVVCYIGIVPLILGLYGLLLPVPERRAARFLTVGGLVMGFGIGYLSKTVIAVNHAIHHPATFIQLTVWGLLFAWPAGWQALDDPGRIRVPRGTSRGWLLLLLGMTIAFGIHHWMSELALRDAASTFWNYSFGIGWAVWLTAGVVVILAIEALRMRLAAAGLLLVAILDIYASAAMVLPVTDEKPVPAMITEGLDTESGRIRMGGDYVDRFLGTKYRHRSEVAAYLEWVPTVGFANSYARHGLYQFDEYNPPFEHGSLKEWMKRLDTASDTPSVETLRRLSGIRYVLAGEDQSRHGWKLVRERQPPVGTWTARLYDAGPVSGAVLMPLSGLMALDMNGLPASASLTPVKMHWNGQTAEGALPGIGSASAGQVLFLPMTPWIGWQLSFDGRPAELLRRSGFGLAAAVPAGARRFELRFRQPWAWHALFASCLGIIGVWFAGRRRSGF
ncbi:MAG TPA: hypothetical protein PLP29_09640 [Candidatus Ozemobacteraceae bacterium]|nr:hypothetical protein [Candidatus Ozemobacteraceae bacterium]